MNSNWIKIKRCKRTQEMVSDLFVGHNVPFFWLKMAKLLAERVGQSSPFGYLVLCGYYGTGQTLLHCKPSPGFLIPTGAIEITSSSFQNFWPWPRVHFHVDLSYAA